MSETTTQPKPTPGRRRQGRNSGRSAAHKAYASEGDMAPHTPEKPLSGSPAAHNDRTTNAKQRFKTKNGKPKNGVSHSPESEYPAHQSTPQQPTSVKGPNAIAFAGATFHASPAPSALPMPSFLSKVTSSSPASKDPQAVVQQPSPPATDAASSTPQRRTQPAQSNESPLDFMFRAHREEKEKQRNEFTSADSHSATPPSNSPFGTTSFAKASTSQTRPTPRRHVSSGGIDTYELDGHFGQPTGPAFSTPYQDRIRAARSNQNRPFAGQENFNHQAYGQSPEDPTEALKKFLFGGNMQSPAASSPTDVASRHALSGVAASPSAARSHDVGFDTHEGNKIQAMENDLRRILNIEAAPAAHNTERRLFTQ